MTATLSTIRDRVRALIAAQTPLTNTRDTFIDSRNEGGADFRAWAQDNPAAALRRFQVRDDGVNELIEVSNTDTDMRYVTLEVVVAYPQTGRYGADQAMDRDDVIDQDFNTLNYAFGIYGRGNFTSTYDCTPLGATKAIERGDGVDFLVMRCRFSFYRATH